MRRPPWIECKIVGYGPAPLYHAEVAVMVRRWHPGSWLFWLNRIMQPNAYAEGTADQAS